MTPVKVLGVLALIDDGELDWKIVALNCNDKMAHIINNVTDVDEHMPHVISGIREWFRWYKTPDNKPLNNFGFDDKCLDRKHALDVVHETHQQYLNLVLNGKKFNKEKLWVSR